MEEALLANEATTTPKTDSLSFSYLPGFAIYIRDNHLVEYIKEQIIISREVNLPMLRFFQNMTDDELIAMAKASHFDFLTAVAENRLREQLQKSIDLWMSDQLGIMKRNEVMAEDITLASYIRKKAMMKLLPYYTSDVNEAIAITGEIDVYNMEADTACTNVYINLLKESVSEHTHFAQVLANTTPGLNYVFNIVEKRLTYANENYLNFFGCTLEELQDINNEFVRSLVHSDDLVIREESLANCAAGPDGAIVSWEYRVKNAQGEYVWMRNYISVFKRDEQGRVTEIVGIVLDVDQEKETAGRLLLREKQLLEAQAQAQVGSFELDVETGKMEVTPQFKEIFGLAEFDLNALIANVHPDDRERINANRDKAIADNGIYDNEYRYQINGNEKILWSRGVVMQRNGRKVLIGTVMDVTSRHEMIRQLVEKEELYKEAQARTHIGNWTWDIKADKVTWSDEMYRVYGLEPQSEAVNYETYLAHIHPEDREERQRQVQHVFETGEPEERYYRIITPDGSIRILHTKSELQYAEDGKPARMTGTCQDVTEKQLLIEQLQQSEKLYKQAQSISHIGNWAWDLETKKIKWSDELYHIYGLELDSITDSGDLTKYNHPEDNVIVDEAIRNAVVNKQPFDFQYRIIVDSKIKTLHAKGELEIAGDRVRAIFGTLQDITEQKLIERQLKDYQEFIEKITNVTPSIIASYNIHTGQYSFINEAVEKMLGYSTTKIMEEGVPFMVSLIHPDDVTTLMERNNQALEEANNLRNTDEEPIVEFKYRLRNSRGEYRWLHTYGTIFERNEHGKVESILNVSVDVTEQEMIEQALFKKNLQLQQSNTSLEEYAYVASHDLKEPLRKISTFSDRILTTQQSTLNEEGRIYLNKIIDASKRMQKMINDLLSVSTITGNKVFEPTDLSQVLSDVLHTLDYKIEENNAIIEASKLPSVTVVPTQFRQLFQNLISNSLKFAKEGEPTHIRIAHKYLSQAAVKNLNLTKANKYLQIEFSDNGIGFDNQYAEKIFAIFQRLHGRADFDGTGIGLAVCRKIVENHDGIIFAKGVVNEGAVFTIIIPV